MRKLFLVFVFVMQVLPIGAQTDSPGLRIDVRLNNDFFHFGEDVGFTVIVQNTTDSDITLDFSSSIQIDYLTGHYRYSDNHDFTDATTPITIPANGSHLWEFNHTPDDYGLEPGWHGLAVELVGTGLYSKPEFDVGKQVRLMPDGVVLSVVTLKETYESGEQPEFTLTSSPTLTRNRPKQSFL